VEKQMREKILLYIRKLSKKDIGTIGIFILFSIVLEIYCSNLKKELLEINNMVMNEKFKQSLYKAFEQKNLFLLHKKIAKIKTVENLKNYFNSSANSSRVFIKNIKYTNEQTIAIKMNLFSYNDVNIMNFFPAVIKKYAPSVDPNVNPTNYTELVTPIFYINELTGQVECDVIYKPDEIWHNDREWRESRIFAENLFYAREWLCLEPRMLSGVDEELERRKTNQVNTLLKSTPIKRTWK
jgi:ribosomal protein L29